MMEGMRTHLVAPIYFPWDEYYFKTENLFHSFVYLPSFIQYQLEYSPLLLILNPLASTPGKEQTIGGKLYANSFSDQDNRGSDSPPDVFTRIVVGSTSCNHNAPNGTE